MIRFAARAAVLIALAGAWGLVGGDRLVAPFLSEAKAEPASPSAPEELPDLASLKIFNRVVLQVKENYFDPGRIQPRQMLVDSLDYVEKQIPEVMVDGDAKAGEVKVTVGGKTSTFGISDVDSIFKMSLRLGQIMGFVQKNLDPGHTPDELRNIEYALVNGMLSSLDPHSILLKPEYFKEMKLSTKGEFGGLGFIIGMTDGDLTVMKVLKGTKDNPTPASKYGIKPKDKILQIAGESTVNMDVTEAAERLRGKPGSRIKVLLMRKGWPEPKAMELPRAKIEIESVVSRLLSDKVGYVRLKNFQGNTSRDLQAAIRDMKAEAGGKLAGLVVDMRGNPGGLLEQAIQVSDTFVDSGTLVTTVGMSNKLREVKKATEGNPDLEKNLPLAVLVNGGSASASEIVAGALKNLDRAVVIGRTTFGKGSVQVLYDFPDQSALKLTIAQYLTPGDVSIQETGITPDVELVASRVTKASVNAFAPVKTMREQDLDKHLANPADLFAKDPLERPEAKKNDPDQKPIYSMRYLRDEPKVKDGEPGLEDDEAEDEELSDDYVEDYQIRFARDLLLAAPASSRSQMLAKMGGFVAGRSAAEEGRIDEGIAGLGVDWAKGAKGDGSAAAPTVTAVFTPAAGNVIRAGDKVDLKLQVTNTGASPVHRMSAWTKSDSNPLLDRREFLVGSLAPGETKSWSVPVEIPKDLASRRDPIVVKLQDADGNRYDDLLGEINIAELPKPRFAYGWQILSRSGPSDGSPHPGEKLTLRVDVKNVGAGASTETTYASIKNKGNEKVFIEKGRQKLGELAPGATAEAVFELELKAGYAESTMPIQLLVFDEKLEEIVVEKLDIPVAIESAAATAAKGLLKPQAELQIRAAPRDDAPVLATAGKGAALPVDGKLGGWTRVEWRAGRIGFVKTGETVAAKGKPSFTAVAQAFSRTPPDIVFEVDTSAGGIAATADHYSLRGKVMHDSLRDVYVFVNDQKVFFAPGGKGGEPLKFAADFPLKEGANHVVVVARDRNEVTSRRAVSVLRRPAELAAQKVAPAPGAVEQKAAPAARP